MKTQIEISVEQGLKDLYAVNLTSVTSKSVNTGEDLVVVADVTFIHPLKKSKMSARYWFNNTGEYITKVFN